MKFGPLMPKKEKKEKPSIDQQIMEAGVRLRALQREYRVVIERELRAVRYSKSQKKENPKATANLKSAFYALSVVNKAQARLREITSAQELAKAMNEMSAVLKLINGIDGKTEKVNTKSLNSGIKKMDKNAAKSDEGQANVFTQPLDELVDDSIIERLLKGDSLDCCLNDEEDLVQNLTDVIPISESIVKDLGPSNDDMDKDMHQIEELSKDL